MASKWEDTVMGEEQRQNVLSDYCSIYDDADAYLLELIGLSAVAQAKITWPIAFEEGRKSRDKEVEEAEKRGAEKVVEWIEQHGDRWQDAEPELHYYGDVYKRVPLDEYQAFLKDLGIEVKE